jgi:TPR repeat protein
LAAAGVLVGGFALVTRLPLPGLWAVAAVALAAVAGTIVVPQLLQAVRNPPGFGFGSRLLLRQETSSCRPIAEATDAVRLGVHPALPAARRPGMPPYVPRDIDAKLDEALGAERLVVLLGDSAAGKSRTAYEALRRLSPGRWLLVPRGPGSLQRLADDGIELRDTVIWLDDLERYLREGGMDITLLDQLADPDRRVVALATMRTGAHDAWIVRAGRDGDGVRGGREVLDTAHVIRLERHLSGDEQRRARVLSRQDRRIGDALAAGSDGIGMAEFLAAAPLLWEHWQNGRASDVNPAGAAIVAAAIDCARAGVPGPMSESLLRDLHRDYMDESTASQLPVDAFEAGLMWATTPVHATSALLRRAGDGFQPFEYLIDRLQQDPRTAPVPDETWRKVLAVASADAAGSIGFAAYAAGNWTIAEAALQAGAASTHPDASALSLNLLGCLRVDQGDLEGAERCYREVIDRQDRHELLGEVAAGYLGVVLQEQGRPEAEGWLRRAANERNPHALDALGRLLAEQGKQDEAMDLFRRAADAGSAVGAADLAAQLELRGDVEGALTAYRRAAHRGASSAARRLSKLLLQRGEEDEGISWVRRAAVAGDLDAANELGELLRSRGDTIQARAWLEHAAHRGYAPAAYHLGTLLAELGQDDQAEQRLLQAAADGGLIAAHNLGALYYERGAHDDAERWLRSVADATDEQLAAHEAELDADRPRLRETAMRNLGNLAFSRGDVRQAQRWLERAATAGDQVAAEQLVELRRLLSDVRRRERRILRAGANADPRAVAELAVTLQFLGEMDRAKRLVGPLAGVGDEQARLQLARIQFAQGMIEPVRSVLPDLASSMSPAVRLTVAELAVRTGMLELGECLVASLSDIADDLTEVGVALGANGHQEEGLWFLRRAANAGTGQAATYLGVLLCASNRVDEGMRWLRQAAEVGDHVAQFQLGAWCKRGSEFAEAEKWYELAAGTGDADAQNNLGVLLWQQERMEEAERWLRRGAEAGDHDAEFNLASLLDTEERVDEAEAWYRRAAGAGHLLAHHGLGALLIRSGRVDEAWPWLGLSVSVKVQRIPPVEAETRIALPWRLGSIGYRPA